MDCSFIAKSGKKTNGYDQFYNGSHNRVERGLEVSLVAVVDVETEVAYSLLAEQTFDQGFCPDLTRMDYYLHHLEIAQPQLPHQIRYLAVDGAYAKEPFVTGGRRPQMVSGMETVEPSITKTLRPHYKCFFVTFSSRFCAEKLKSFSNNFSGSLALAWQYPLFFR
ncbi:hypothetical protein [Nostoc sp. DSM 114160]